MSAPRTKLVTTLCCAACLGAIGGEPGAVRAEAITDDGEPAQVQRAHGSSWFGWGRHHRRAGHGERLCGAPRDQWLQDRIDLVESFADFNPEQAAAWTELTEAVRSASARVGEACQQVEAAEDGDGLPGRLAMAELMLTTGLAVLRDVRPAFDRFYEVSSDEQRAALDRVVGSWRRH